MDAKELHYELRGGGRMWVEGASEDEEETILRALSLLAAAEANDGTTPETDNPNNIDSWRATKDRSRSLERERNGLARAYADTLEENARLKEELAKLRQHAEAMAGWVRAFANNVDTRKLLAEYDAYRADFQGEK